MTEDSQGHHRAVFLDRDGTINLEVGYLDDPQRLVLIAGAAEAIRSLKAAGWLVLVISNQSGVGRGYFPEETLHYIHRRLVEELAQEGAHLDGIYYCPHTPWEGCSCRKPSPELLRRASREHDIALERSWMIGDKATDVATGKNAGCHTALVLTGYGELESSADLKPDLVVPDLRSAVRALLQETALDSRAGNSVP